MSDHPIPWLLGALAGAVAAVAAAVATRVQLLPEVIDISIVPTAAGFGGLLAAACGAAFRFDSERLARVTLLGNLIGAALAAAGLLLVVVVDVLS